MLAAFAAQLTAVAVVCPKCGPAVRKATWPAAAVLGAKRPKLERCYLLVSSASPQRAPHERVAGQREVELMPLASTAAGAGAPTSGQLAAAAGTAAAAAAAGPVLVTFKVPSFCVAYGEQLRVVGGCKELGGWSPAAAPALTWHEGDSWSADVALPPGQHALKLVRCRQDGGEVEWEEGANRALRVPELAAAASGRALLCVTCQYGDTSATELVADRAQLQAVADAAAARVADLMRRKAGLAAKLASLEAEVLASEGKIASAAADAERLVSAELARQLDVRRQREERLELAAAAAELRAELGGRAAAAVQTSAGAGQLLKARARARAPLGTPAAAPLQLAGAAAGMRGAEAEVRATSDGSLHFCFAASLAGSSHQPTALELAKERLAARLPGAAAAALERQLSSMDRQLSGGKELLQHAVCSSSSRSQQRQAAGTGSLGSSSSTRHELVSSAVSAAGLAGAGAASQAPAHRRLARQVSLLKQEVAAGARLAADLSEDFELLLSLGNHSSHSTGSSHKGSGSSSSKGVGGSGRRPKQPPQQQQVWAQPGQAAGYPARPTAAAYTTKAGGAAAAVAVAEAEAAPSAPALPERGPGVSGHTRSTASSRGGSARGGGDGRRSSATAAAKAKAKGKPAALAAPAAAAAQHAVGAISRGSFPVVAAWLAAEALWTAGSLVWSASRAAVPRPVRGAAGAAFWLGYAALVAVPLLSA